MRAREEVEMTTHTWRPVLVLALSFALTGPALAQEKPAALKPVPRTLPLANGGFKRLKQRTLGHSVRQVVELPGRTVMRKDRFSYDRASQALRRRSTEVQIDKADGTVIISQRGYLPRDMRMNLGTEMKRGSSRLWLALKALFRSDSSHVVTLPPAGGRVERMRLGFSDQTVRIHKVVKPDGEMKAVYRDGDGKLF
jgi:hypothetical protein